MAKLADAPDSKFGIRKGFSVQVRVRLFMKRIIRKTKLSKEEAAENDSVRKKIAKEKDELIERHLKKK